MAASKGVSVHVPGAKVPEALGRSEVFLDFQARLSRVARIDRPVLLAGERGTGKELAATRLHYLSERWDAPLVTLNCAALSPSLIESELFGHEAGAFTGATGRRRGRFEMADGGSLFLDEVGLIPIEAQEKILRAVEYLRFERVGGQDSVEVDVRIIAATNADLPGLAARGKFKEDLLDRLSFEVLFLPPLRERGEDILFLARRFAAHMASELGFAEVPTFTAEASAALEAHPWPGNVRELKNVVERAVYRAEGGTVDAIEFDPFRSPFARPSAVRARQAGPPAEPSSAPARMPDISVGRETLPDAVRRLEISAITEAMRRARHKQTAAARLLGLTYDQFRGLWRKYRAALDPHADTRGVASSRSSSGSEEMEGEAR